MKLRAAFIFALICLTFPTGPAFAQGETKKVLILYQERIPAGARYDAVSALAGMISHFDAQTVELQCGEYRSGTIGFYDAVFYLGIGNEPPPESFCEDVMNEKEKTICWLGGNIGSLTERSDSVLRFKVKQKEKGFDSLNYKGFSFGRGSEEVFVIEVLDRKKAKPYGSLFRKNEFIPYAVSVGNFWYACELPFSSGGAAYVFCDLLHEILNEDHQFSKYAAIRVADIHPETDPKQLRMTLEVFEKYEIPFLFSVIPVYTHSSGKRTVRLSEKPYLVFTLVNMQEGGGSAVLRGYDYRDDGKGAAAYEFWDKTNDSPLEKDSEEMVRDKLTKGILECVLSDIYPLAWETPQYSASELDYKVFGEIFSTGVERLQLSDELPGAKYTFPYFIKSREGRWIIPENIGYADSKRGHSAGAMLDEARKLLVVRDAVAVGYVYPGVEAPELEKLIVGLKELGYSFIDLRELPNQVKTEEFMLFSGLNYFHGDRPVGRLFYNWPVSSLLKVDLYDQYLQTFFLDEKFRRNDTRLPTVQVAGEVTMQLPDRAKLIFVVRKWDTKPTGWEILKKAVGAVFRGKKSLSFADTLMRFMMWIFFIITAALLVVLVVIYAHFMFTRRMKS